MKNPENLVEKVVHRDFPEAQVLRVRETSGLAHKVFVVELSDPDRRLVANFCHEKDLEDRFEVEPEVTRLVERRTDVPVPQVIRSDLSKSFVPYMYYLSSVVPGYNPKDRFKYMPVWKKRKILRQAGRFLGKIHKIDFDRFGHLEIGREREELSIYGPEEWVEVFKAVMFYQLDHAHERFEDIIPQLKRAFEDNLHLLEGDFQPVLLHQDYGPRNIHINDSDISGVLDWERAISGHKEYDFFKAETRFVYTFQEESLQERYRKPFYEGYREINSFEDNWKERRDFYQYCTLFEPFWTFDPENLSENRAHQFENKIRGLIDSYIEKLD